MAAIIGLSRAMFQEPIERSVYETRGLLDVGGEVRANAGHANVSITSGYLHVAVEDEAAVGTLNASAIFLGREHRCAQRQER